MSNKLLFFIFILPLHLFALPADFVYLKQFDDTIIQDMRYASSHNFVGRPITGYAAQECIVTKETALALARLQKALKPQSLGLKVFDCYRPVRAVDEFIAWSENSTDQKMKETYYPHIRKEDLFRLNFLAEKSGHSRGSTVDLTLVRYSKFFSQPIEVDMGTHFDFLDQASHTMSNSVSPQVRQHRLFLRKLMFEAGFAPIAVEWWHFTLSNEKYPDTYFDFVIK